jgi:hypothetical protein
MDIKILIRKTTKYEYLLKVSTLKKQKNEIMSKSEARSSE